MSTLIKDDIGRNAFFRRTTSKEKSLLNLIVARFFRLVNEFLIENDIVSVLPFFFLLSSVDNHLLSHVCGIIFNTSVNMDEIMWHNVIRHGLVRIFYPCLMLFGTIGNILCLKILLRKRFRRQSTCQYLCILAVIDILFIYMRSSRYLYRSIYKDDLRNRSMWICRIFIYFSSALSHLASWILVIVSFDRYFIVKNLFLRRRHVGWRVIKSTCVLILIISIVNLHYLQILGKLNTLMIMS